jgi:hypothetical protein
MLYLVQNDPFAPVPTRLVSVGAGSMQPGTQSSSADLGGRNRFLLCSRTGGEVRPPSLSAMGWGIVQE